RRRRHRGRARPGEGARRGTRRTGAARSQRGARMIDPRISRETPVIMQGVTGRAGRSHFQLMRAYGTNIMAGVSPRVAGTEVEGVPLFGSSAEAVAATGARASVLFVGAEQLLAAIEEA